DAGSHPAVRDVGLSEFGGSRILGFGFHIEKFVIPGRRTQAWLRAASPESILPGGGYGFRARGLKPAPRNDTAYDSDLEIELPVQRFHETDHIERSVIPGRRTQAWLRAVSPESILPGRGYGFRA